MSIVHVNQIRAKLLSLYVNQIDLSDCSSKSQSDRDSIFLTRSLAAFVISALVGLPPEKTASCVTDGYQDNGIDAIYFDDVESVLYLVQTKWKHDGSGGIDRGDTQKFIQGVKDLLNARYDRFNQKVNNYVADIDEAISRASTKISLVVAYTGQANLGNDISRDFDDLLKEMNDPSEVIEFHFVKQADLHRIVASGAFGSPINFDVVLKDWGQVRTPFLAFYGQVAATEVANWWNQYHPRLFAANIRSFLGITEINQVIVETLGNEPENFWYFNNGITALCGTIKKKPIGGNTHDSGVFECTDVSIVNGAQTVGAIASAFAKYPEQVSQASVMVRFISLDACPEDFGIRVTRATNTQNRIEKRDFVSLDSEQERLRTDLRLDGIEYAYKAGYTVGDSKQGFDLTEATVALACAQPELSYSLLAKSRIGQLWEDVSKAPYKVLFNAGLSGLKLWRLVQIQRKVDEVLKIQQTKYYGRDAKLPVHGNRFVARQVFRHISPGKIEDPSTDFQEILSQVPTLAAKAVDLSIKAVDHEYADSYLANLFKNLGKCSVVEKRLDSYWN